MKEPMNNIYYKILMILTVVMLQACGSSNETPYSISANVSDASFSNEFLHESTDTIAIDVTFEGESLIIGFAPDSQRVAWLTYRSESVTTNSATLHIDVTNAESFLPDLYDTKIRIAVGNDDASKFAYHDIDISLLVWNLATNNEQVDFSGTYGDANVAVQTLDIISEDNEWTASVDVDWLTLDVTSGSGDGSIAVTADISEFSAAGLQQGNIILTEVTSGDTKSIPVELALDNVYLYADSTNIAFTATDNINAIEKTITISNNSVAQIDWQASTDASWLTLTPIGTTQLQITADINLAPINATSAANITISSSDGVVAIDEMIKVNFYNSNLVVENKIIEPLVINEPVANNEKAIIASPSLPLFYVSVDNALRTYHQYTSELENTLVVSPEGTTLEQLIMHPNGDYLLAKALETVTNDDETTDVVTHRYRIDLNDNSVVEITEPSIFYEPVAIVRLSGRYFVVTSTLEFADENLQLLYWDGENAYFANAIDTATQANTLFALDNNSVELKRYTAQVNDFGVEKIKTTLTHAYHPELLGDGQNISDFIVSNDEKNIYAISETSEWISFDGESFSDHGLLETNEDVVTLFLEKSSDSNPNYLRIDVTDIQGFYLAMYDNQQTIATTFYTGGRLPNSITLSVDTQRLLINSDTTNNPDVDSHLELVSFLP
ncbi:MAG: hypothetical protein OCD00_13445 [Colwellia sp.]